MNIVVVCGNLGAGKTATLSVFSRWAYLNGESVVTNYKITGYPNKYIDNINDLKKFDGSKTFLALDEFWIWSDSRSSNSNDSLNVQRSMMQIRKRNVKSCFMSAQHFGQIDNRTRNITSTVYFPELMHDPDTGYPVMIKVKFITDLFRAFDMDKLPYFYLPTIINGFPVLDNYNTNEIIEEPDNMDISLSEMKAKYGSYAGSKCSLESILEFDENIPNTLAKRVASYILA